MTAELSASTNLDRGDRLQAIDFTKGALVIFMVLYHSFNYSTERGLGFQYLAFLPPSFILVTGFLIALVYFPRPQDQDAATSRRMIARGVKLLILFTALNLLGALVSSRKANGQPMSPMLFLSNWEQIYFTGAGSQAAFEVLVPIAYLLILSPVLLWLSRQGPWTVPALALLMIIFLAVLDTMRGAPFNLAMMTAGLMGAGLGCLPRQIIDQLGRFWYLPIALYAVLEVLAHDLLSQSSLLHLTAALLAVAALFAIGSRFQKPAWLMRRLDMLGKYSLLAYILQIGFLQIFSHSFGRPEPDSPDFVILFGVTLLVTLLAAESTDWLRARSRTVDNAYRLVFA